MDKRKNWKVCCPARPNTRGVYCNQMKPPGAFRKQRSQCTDCYNQQEAARKAKNRRALRHEASGRSRLNGHDHKGTLNALFHRFSIEQRRMT